MLKQRVRWADVYTETELYKAAVRLYTKPLFNWRKALSTSDDQRTLYDFARHGLKNLSNIHRALRHCAFTFRPGTAVHHNFNGKQRTLYIYPWEEKLVDLLLYRVLTRKLNDWFSPHSYAYRLNGWGVDRCQRRVAKTLRSGLPRPVYLIKRDIRDYFGSIDHRILLAQLGDLIDSDDYLFELLGSRIRFQYQNANTLCTAARGIPFGTAIACFLANVHLTGLDRAMANVPNLTYFRYADDLLAVATEKDAGLTAVRILVRELRQRNLTCKPSHTLNLVFRPETHTADTTFVAVPHFRHLGLQFRADGSVGLSRDKVRKIQNLFRYEFRRRNGRFRKLTDPVKRAQLAVHLARQTLDRGIRNVAIIDYYLKHVKDEDQLRQIDKWLAEEVLSRAFGGGHKKGYFRKISYRQLRKMGLPSLVHRRRLIQHGHLPSPFLVWKTQQQMRRSGPRAAKPAVRDNVAVAAAFSPDPEAAVVNTS